MKATALCLGLMALGADARIRDLAKKLRKAERKGGSSVTMDVSPGSSTTNRTTTEEDYWKQWNDFQDMTGNNYLTSDEHDARYEIFKDNIDKINRHNSQGLSWWLGVTPFADLTADEFKEKIVGVKDDKPACTFDENRASNEFIFEDTSNNPDSVDWVAKGMVTPVKNQGQCGSCWAFSTTGALEARYAISTGKLNSLSEQELVDCAGAQGNNGCKGGLMDYGFTYVQQQHGLCLESDFPYVARTETLKCDQDRSACQHYDPISGFKDVQKYSSEQLETALAQGPVSIAIEADQTAFQLYKGGVLKGRCGKRLDHGVLAVGYDNTGSDHYWKVKNSWGPTWGEQGYIRLCKDCNANCGGIGNRCYGQCGLLGQPSYPVV